MQMKAIKRKEIWIIIVCATGMFIWLQVQGSLEYQQISAINKFMGHGITLNKLYNYFLLANFIILILKKNISIVLTIVFEIVLLIPICWLVYFFLKQPISVGQNIQF